MRHNKPHFKDLLIKNGAMPLPDPRASKKVEPKQKNQVPAQPKQKVNERLIPKEFVLQILDEGQYRPITEEEFELLR